ncbi:MAG: alpha-amylase family glycosyl hydrolase [Prevotella sp.]
MNIDRIDPPFWYVGMTSATLQLMVSGSNIGRADVEISHKGVEVVSVTRLENPDYLILYLDISKAAEGTFQIKFIPHADDGATDAHPGEPITRSYRLCRREKEGSSRTGFGCADVLYLLMPDRFACGGNMIHPLPGMKPYRIDRTKPSLRHGGNLEGIRRRLDYFCELGVTALWLTPVLENDQPDYGDSSSYHGYAITDHYSVDARLGSNSEYRQLVDEAHAKGLKVIMDMVFNHCGFSHRWVAGRPSSDWFNAAGWLDDYEKARQKGSPAPEEVARTSDRYLQTAYRLTPIADIYAADVDVKNTVEGWFVPAMPDLNLRNPHVLTYLKQSSFWWIETVGIDGIRMDTYPYADAEAMARWAEELNEEYPNFKVVGETWVADPAFTAAWQSGSKLARTDTRLKSVMDFSFFDRINAAKHEETDEMWHGLNRIYHCLASDFLYPEPADVLAFIDNHDTDRFLGDRKNIPLLKQALALLLTVKRTPQIYYGTEILMNGTAAKGDGNVRRDFPGGFPDDGRDAFTQQGRTLAEESMFRWLSKLLHWRRGNDVITDGTQTHFMPYGGVYVLARRKDTRAVLTVANGTEHTATFEVAHYAEVICQASHGRDVISGKRYSLTTDIRLRPRQTLVLELSYTPQK